MAEEQELQSDPSAEVEEAPASRDKSKVTRLKSDADLPMPAMNDKTYSRVGMLVLLVFFGGLGFWSATAPLDSAIVAVGKVQVGSSRKTIQHLEGGLVSEIAVEDGDLVEKDQLLLRLDDTQSRAQLDIIRWQSYSEQAKLDRLKAERDGLSSVSFTELADAQGVGSDEVKDLRWQEAQLFKFRKESLSGEIAVLEQRKEQSQEQIEGLKSVVKLNHERIALFAEGIKEWKSLYDRQLADKLKLRQTQHEKLELEVDVADQSAKIAQLKIQLGEIQSQILLRKQQFMTEVLQQLRESQTELADQRIRMVSLSDRVNRTFLKAPESGVVVGMDVHTLGAVISPGKPILHIVPQDKDFVVEARIDTTEIDRVLTGQLSDIRFSAFDSQETQVIEGRVKRVSADSYSDERTGAPYYEVTVEVTDTGLGQMQEDKIELVSGMPAEVMIKTGGRTLLQYVVQPFTDMLARSFKEE